MSIQIDRPGSADQLDLSSLLNSLLLIRPTAHQNVTTAYGDKDAVEADVHVVDGDLAGTVYRNAYLFPLVLQGQLRKNVGTGRFNLGRLGKRAATRPGTNPAWALADPTAADLDAAEKYAAANGLTSEPPAPKVEEKSADLWGADAATAPPF
jgi:hypothetical protein